MEDGSEGERGASLQGTVQADGAIQDTKESPGAKKAKTGPSWLMGLLWASTRG